LVPTTGVAIAAIWARWGLAVLALSQGDAAAADAALDPLTTAVESTGIAEPIRCAYLADHIEALIALGRLDRADRLTGMLDEAGMRHARGWVQHQAGRCRALLLAARGDLDGAAQVADKAVETGRQLEHRLEYARTLLAGAQIERRCRRRARARERCSLALAIFEQAGAHLWAERARDEQSRTAARPGGSELTETERRVAELAGAGRTNREVAAALFISPKTVEANLARVYTKFGIHSRAELGSLIGRRRESPDGSRVTND
jgi:DNA-binding CsgD family transcriptional regulator